MFVGAAGTTAAEAFPFAAGILGNIGWAGDASEGFALAALFSTAGGRDAAAVSLVGNCGAAMSAGAGALVLGVFAASC